MVWCGNSFTKILLKCLTLNENYRNITKISFAQQPWFQYRKIVTSVVKNTNLISTFETRSILTTPKNRSVSSSYESPNYFAQFSSAYKRRSSVRYQEKFPVRSFPSTNMAKISLAMHECNLNLAFTYCLFPPFSIVEHRNKKQIHLIFTCQKLNCQ